MNKDEQLEQSGKGPLRPKARLLRTLGRDLISSDKVALIELVKNSYDADASLVMIRFHGPLHSGKGYIEVWDDGHGMDLSTIKNSWLDIATNTKRNNTRSSGGRRVLGEKGIGRLAVARLGDQMVLTTKRDQYKEIQISIDWREFDRDDAYLNDIEISWKVGETSLFSKNSPFSNIISTDTKLIYNENQGTVISINSLTKNWKKRDIVELRTALTRLIRPIPNDIGHLLKYESGIVNDFKIILELIDVDESWEYLSGPIEASVDLQKPHYRITGSVSSEGDATLNYEQISPPIKEQIGPIQLLNNPQISGDKSNNIEVDTQVGPFVFDIAAWDLDSDSVRSIHNILSSSDTELTNKQITNYRNAIKDVAGISIYRDGFRVLPFGEKGNDWLGLDHRRVNNPTLRLSNNQIIGHIFISADANKYLEDQSNREGILIGPAYYKLQYMIRTALNELEVRRFKARPREEKAKFVGGLYQRFNTDELDRFVSSNYPSDKQLMSLLKSHNHEIQGAISELQNILSRYSRLATLGTLIDRVLHDGRTVITRLKNISRFTKRYLGNSNITNTHKIDYALESCDSITEQTVMLSSLFNQIEPFGGRKQGRPKKINIADLIKQGVLILQDEANKLGVEIIVASPDITITINESEFLVIIVNLLQNAVYWTSTLPKSADRKVLVGSRRNIDDSVTLIVSDSGPGIPQDNKKDIFEPYFSTKPNGIGLGLSIVGHLVEDIYCGELVLVHSGPLDGATFEATFRRRV